MKRWLVGLALTFALAFGLVLRPWETPASRKEADDTKNQPSLAEGVKAEKLALAPEKRTSSSAVPRIPDLAATIQTLDLDEAELRRIAGEMAECEECVGTLIPILMDPGKSLEQRKAAAELLAASGRVEGTRALLEALISAHLSGDQVTMEELLHVLANLDSPEAAASLVDFLSTDPALLELPAELLPFIQKVLANMSAESRVGHFLIEAYRGTANPEIRARLEAFKHPQLEAARLIESWRLGDSDTAEQCLDRLMGNEMPEALDGLMVLAQESTLPLERLNSMVFEWAQNTGNPEIFDSLLEHLTRFDASPAERSMAAHGLAGLGPDSESALRKALSYETDPVVSEQIQLAISELQDGKK